MRGIAKFYTLFWIVYFPTCIAFNEMQSMKLVERPYSQLYPRMGVLFE